MTKKAVLLFGGFNPFTNAHLHIGRLAKENFPDHEIIYIPAKMAYFQRWKHAEGKDILPEELRLNMIRVSVETEPDFRVCDAELNGLSTGRTWNTLEYLRQQEDYGELVLCMGTDKVPELETWEKGHQLIEENRFFIITRGERLADRMTPFTLEHRDHFVEIENTLYADYSATRVRRAMWEGDRDYINRTVPAPAASLLLAHMDRTQSGEQ